MKRNNIYWLLGLLLLFSSCDVLNLAPEDFYASGNYWKNESHVNSYMNGLHSRLREKYNILYQLGEERGGTQRISSASQGNALNEVNPIKNNNFSASLSGISNWGGLYTEILYINSLIRNLEEGCDFLSTEQKNKYLGQGYGLRAFYYFLLYRTYGGLPLLKDDQIVQGEDDPQVFYTPRSSAKATLDFIKEDINTSIAKFNNKNEIGTRALWSLGASLALKADIYLWSGKVTLQDQKPADGNADLFTAQDALIKLQSMPEYGLETSFENIFASTNKGGKEIIFTIRFNEGEAENNIQTLYQINSFVGNSFDIKGKRITTDVLDMRVERQQRHEYLFDFWLSYDAKDQRRDVTFYPYYRGVFLPPNLLIKSDSGTLMKKFMGKINESETRIYESDIPVYRYADILLMRAEVENSLGMDPTPYLNPVRRRAYGVSITTPSIYDFANLSFAENELNILSERDKEFVWEGKRWFDLCRMQDATKQPLVFSADASYIVATPGTKIKSPVLTTGEKNKLLWPIDINTLSRNPELINNDYN